MEDKDQINSFLKCLENKSHHFYELAKFYNIYPKITKLNSELWGFVYKSSNDNYYIIINKNLSYKLQQQVFIHEVKHIRDDIPGSPYFIGLNMKHSNFEQNANKFSQNFISKLNN